MPRLGWLAGGGYFRRLAHQARELRIPRLQKVPQPNIIVRRDGAAHRCACRKRLAVGGNLWLAAKDAKVSDAIKRIEIAKHRTEYDIDQRKPLAVEIPARSFALTKTRFKPREFLSQSLDLLRER